MSHSILAPSSAGIWLYCPFFPTVNQQFPSEETEHTLKGTAAHWVAEQILNSYINGGIITNIKQLPDYAPNDEPIDNYMFNGAKLYVNYILKICNERGLLSKMNIEKRVNIHDIHAHCFGTPDLWMYDEKFNEVFIMDFKYGFELVIKYWQHACYGTGVLAELGKLTDRDIKVTMVTVQPRAAHPAGPIRSITVGYKQMWNMINQLRQAANKAFEGNKEACAGNHCFNCPAKSQCPAFNELTHSALQFTTEANLKQLSSDELGTRIMMLRYAKDIIDSLLESDELDAQERIMSGDVVKHLGMTNKKSSRRIKNDCQDKIITIGRLYKKKLYKEKAFTYNQCIDAGIDPRVILPYTHLTGGGSELVEESMTKAALVFDNLNQTEDK